MKQTFMQFLDEAVTVSQTKRESIAHLENMKPLEFIRLAKKIMTEKKGKLDGIPVSLKVDGLGARFGRDRNGNFFFETSRSGPINTRGAFTKYNEERGVTDKNLLNRASHYDKLYEELEDSPIWHHLPDDTKVICEILYNPMATFDADGVKFVNVKYDKKKLGDLMTIIPFSVVTASTGAEMHEESIIIGTLAKMSGNRIKILNPRLGELTVDISATLNPITLFDDDVIETLKSRRPGDRVAKQEYIDLIQKVKEDIAMQLLREPVRNKDLLGSEIEGLVMKIGDHKIKVTTPEFKSKVSKK